MCRKRQVVIAMAVVFSLANFAIAGRKKTRNSCIPYGTVENWYMRLYPGLFNRNVTVTSRQILKYRLLDDIYRMGFEEAPLYTFPDGAEPVSNTSQVELDNSAQVISSSISPVKCKTETDTIVPVVVSIVGTEYDVVHLINNYQIVFYGYCSSESDAECVLRWTWRSLLIKVNGSDVFANVEYPTYCECP